MPKKTNKAEGSVGTGLPDEPMTRGGYGGDPVLRHHFKGKKGKIKRGGAKRGGEAKTWNDDRQGKTYSEQGNHGAPGRNLSEIYPKRGKGQNKIANKKTQLNITRKRGGVHERGGRIRGKEGHRSNGEKDPVQGISVLPVTVTGTTTVGWARDQSDRKAAESEACVITKECVRARG